MKRISLALFAALAIVGCRNPYVDFYKELRPKSEVWNANLFLPSTSVQVITTGDLDAEDLRMAENGFVMIGYSSFNGGEVSESMAVDHAKAIGASHVVIFRKQTASMQGTTNYFMPSIGMSVGVPQEYRRFDHAAQYFATQNPKSVRLGIFYIDLTQDQKTKLQTNKGVCVQVVIKGSPAYRVDILKGDIIRTVNDEQVEDHKHLTAILTKLEGQMVTLGIVRGDETKRIDVQLNRRT